MNNNQRAHVNLVEQLPISLGFYLIGLFIIPAYIHYLCYVYVAGRVLYMLGYKTGGAGLRLPGAFIATPQTHVMCLAFPAYLCY